MKDGILFNNILIANDEKSAKSIKDSTWKPKFSVEGEKQKAEEYGGCLQKYRDKRELRLLIMVICVLVFIIYDIGWMSTYDLKL